MKIDKPACCFFLLFSIVLTLSAQQKPSAGSPHLFGKTKTKLTPAEKNHLFEQLGIKWSESKKQFVDNDDEKEAAPYMAVHFFPADINNDGNEEVFIVLSNPALFEKAGAQIIFFAIDSDGSYQKNTEIPAEDIVPLSRKHLGYPDILLSGDGPLFVVWRWNGKIYQYFQKVNGQQLPNGPNKGLEEISQVYQAGLKK